VLAYLRAVTRPAHSALEGALGLLDDRLDLDAYRVVLGRLYGFWRGWEPQMAALLRDDGLLGQRRRLHLLAADLAALGVSSAALEALPMCPLTMLRDDAEALGSLYVMEGSTLGGLVIQRNINRCLGDKGRRSCSYFNGYGTETGPMWRVFLARLDEAPTADMERIGFGASATFERIGWWLTKMESVT
jgi:heme oxygenase (biliverdin-IX-beta and delta-forming)